MYMRQPGIKPGSGPWQGPILSLYYWRIMWSIWVSIPVPRACKARALPIAPIPRKFVQFTALNSFPYVLTNF